MKKLLAFIIVLAVVLSMAPAAALAAGETVEITNSAELNAAILNQDDGQTWNLAPGTTFDLDPSVYQSLEIHKLGFDGSHFVFPIIKDGLTIKGGPGTVITSSYVTPDSGAWNYQNFITIAGDNVTLDGLTLIPNMNLYEVNDGNPSGVNKLIEVIGSGSVIKNLRGEPNPAGNGDFAGSIYYSNGASGSTDTLENVYLLNGRISLSGKNSGVLNMTGVTIDFVGALACARDFIGFQSNTGVSFLSSNVTLMMNQHRMDIFNTQTNKPDVNQVVGDQDTEVTATAESSYIIVIPAAVDFGTLSKSMPEQSKDFYVKIEDALLQDGTGVRVDIFSAFRMDQAPGSAAALSYNLFNQNPAAGTPLASGDAYCTFVAGTAGTGETALDANLTATVNGAVTCLPSQLTRAGSYSGTMVFDISNVG